MHYQPFPKGFVEAGNPSPLLSQESVMTTGSLDDFLALVKTQEASGSTRYQSKSEVPQELAMNNGNNNSSSSSDEEDWLEEVPYSDESNADHTETSAADDLDGSLSSEEMQLLVDILVEQEDQESTFEPLFAFRELYTMDWDETETTSTAPNVMEPIPFPMKSSSLPPPPSVLKPKTVTATKPPMGKTKSNKTKAIKARPTVKKGKEQIFSEPITLVSQGKAQVQQEQRNKRVRKVYDAPFGQRSYFELTALDVGLGRGGEMNRHPGNLRFHEAKRSLQPHYLACFKDSRTDVAQALVDQVHQWGGRFLKKDQKGYYEVHNHTARTKCSQALREIYTQEERAAKREKHRQLKKLKQT